MPFAKELRELQQALYVELTKAQEKEQAKQKVRHQASQEQSSPKQHQDQIDELSHQLAKKNKLIDLFLKGMGEYNTEEDFEDFIKYDLPSIVGRLDAWGTVYDTYRELYSDIIDTPSGLGDVVESLKIGRKAIGALESSQEDEVEFVIDWTNIPAWVQHAYIDNAGDLAFVVQVANNTLVSWDHGNTWGIGSFETITDIVEQGINVYWR